MDVEEIHDLAEVRARHLAGELLEHEKPWRDRYEFLRSHGYVLRPRYRPGWTPSWHKSGILPLSCEDWIAAPTLSLDAVRASDGKRVVLKQVDADSDEQKIASMLYSKELFQDPRNHSVPILEVLQDKDPDTVFLVMPCLRPIYDPPFVSVQDVVDLVHQLLEGLVFMHSQGVAHRDCSVDNLMMDADTLFPYRFHSVMQQQLPDFSDSARQIPRRRAKVRYLYVDYGISSYFPLKSTEARVVVGLDGRDRDVPELSDDVPYDPFKVDVFLIGNMFKNEIYQKYSNVGFLKPLIESMTTQDPATRPTAVEAWEQWKFISHRPMISLRRMWRLRDRNENIATTVLFDLFNLCRLSVRLPVVALGRSRIA